MLPFRKVLEPLVMAKTTKTFKNIQKHSKKAKKNAIQRMRQKQMDKLFEFLR